MKCKFLLLSIILTMTMTFSLMAQSKAAVLPFTAGDNIDRFTVAVASEYFSNTLEKSDKYMLIDQSDVFRQINDVPVYLIREFDIDTAVKIGQTVGADVIFVGNAFRSGSKVCLSVKCITVSDGKVSIVKNGTADSDDLLKEISRSFAMQINLGKESDESIDVQMLSIGEQKTRNMFEKKNLDVTNQSIMRHRYGGGLAGGISMAVIGGLFGVAGSVCGGLGVYTNKEVANEKNRLEQEYDQLSPEEKKKYYKDYDNSFYSDYSLEEKEERGRNEYVEQFHEKKSYIMLSVCAAPILATVGCITAILSALPFYFAYQVKSIYQKSTGQKLFAFLQRTSITGSYDWTNREATFAMAIKL